MDLKYFKVQEFVPPEIYQRRKDKAIECMDYRIINTAEILRHAMREEEGQDNGFTINNWHINGNRTESGLRIPSSKFYSTTSQHSFGRALDIVTKTPIKLIHAHILKNLILYPCIRFIEVDITWLHIDCRHNSDSSRIKLWSPKRGYVDVDAYLVELTKGHL